MNRYTLFLLFLAALTSACATPLDTSKETPSKTALLSSPIQDTASPRLQWLPSGRYLRIGNRWLLDNAGRFLSLPPLPLGHSAYISPDDKNLAVVGDNTLRVGPLQGNLGAPIPIPLWVASETVPIQRADVHNVAYWLDTEHLFVQQFHLNTNTEHACRVFSIASKRWRQPTKGCVPHGEAHTLHTLQPGPDNLLLIRASKRGSDDISLIRYSSVEGQLPARAPHLDIYPTGPLEASFGKQGSLLLLSTPCTLDSKSDPPCLNIHEDSLWKVYVFDPASGLLSMRDFNLPARVSPHPNTRSFAWTQGTQVCIGDPRSKLPPNCVDLPKDPTLTPPTP